MHRVSAIVALVIGCASLAHAQASTSLTKPISIGISGGAAVPSGELANGRDFGFTGTNTGYNVTGSVAFALPVVPFNLRLDASYDKFGSRNLTFPAITLPNCPCGIDGEPIAYNAAVRVRALTANVVYQIPLPTLLIRPYVIGGAGVYNVVQTPTRGDDYSQTNAGYDLGAGAALPLGAFHPFIEARYHRVNQHSGSVAFIPITVGVMF